MNEKVNYEDNLFYISMMIKNIKQSFKLNLAEEFFSERQAEEIIFIFHSLQKFLKDLSDNSYLINRNQYLYTMIKVQDHFTEMADQFLQIRQNNLWDEAMTAQIRKAIEKTLLDKTDIRDLLHQQNQDDVEKDLISNEELNFLMAPGLQEEEDDSVNS